MAQDQEKAGHIVAYRIEFIPKAQRAFNALDGSIRGRIARRIDSLAWDTGAGFTGGSGMIMAKGI